MTAADSVSRLVGRGVLAPDRLLQLVEPENPKHRNWLMTAIVLLLMLVTVALLDPKLRAAAPWGDPIGGVLFLLCGAALLWTVAGG